MKFDEFCKQYGIGRIIKSYHSNYISESSFDEFDGIEDNEDEDDFEDEEIRRIGEKLEKWLKQFCRKYKLKTRFGEFDVESKVTPSMEKDLKDMALSLHLSLKVENNKNSKRYCFWYVGMREEDIVESIVFRF